MYRTILAPTDGSEAAERAARHAIDLADEFGATLHVVYVVDEGAGNLLLSTSSMASVLEALTEEGERATARIAEMAEAAGVEVETEVIQSIGVHGTICNYARSHDVDLIVMGTHGRHGLEHFLGSTTERVLASASIPVLGVSGPAKDGQESTDGQG